MPRKTTLQLNKKTLSNLFRAREVSAALQLGNIIQKKRLNATLKSLPQQVTKGLKSLGLAGGKRKTRKMKKSRKTRKMRR
jgi:hypothetical protein